MTPVTTIPTKKRKANTDQKSLSTSKDIDTASTVHAVAQQSIGSHQKPSKYQKDTKPESDKLITEYNTQHQPIYPTLSNEEISNLQQQIKSKSLTIEEIIPSRLTLIHNNVKRKAVRDLFNNLKQKIQQSLTLDRETQTAFLNEIRNSGKLANKIQKKQPKRLSESAKLLQQIRNATLPLDQVQPTFYSLCKIYSRELINSCMGNFKKNLLLQAKSEAAKLTIQSHFIFPKTQDASDADVESSCMKLQLKNKLLSCNFDPEEGAEIIRKLVNLKIAASSLRTLIAKARKNIASKNWTQEKKKLMSNSLFCGYLIKANVAKSNEYDNHSIQEIRNILISGTIEKSDIFPIRLRLLTLEVNKNTVQVWFARCKHKILQSSLDDAIKQEMIKEIDKSGRATSTMGVPRKKYIIPQPQPQPRIIHINDPKLIVCIENIEHIKSTIKSGKVEKNHMVSLRLQLIDFGIDRETVREWFRHCKRVITTSDLSIEEKLALTKEIELSGKQASKFKPKTKTVQIKEHSQQIQESTSIQNIRISEISSETKNKPYVQVCEYNLEKIKKLMKNRAISKQNIIPTSKAHTKIMSTKGKNATSKSSKPQPQIPIALQKIQSGQIESEELVEAVQSLLHTTSAEAILEAVYQYEDHNPYYKRDVETAIELAKQILKTQKSTTVTMEDYEATAQTRPWYYDIPTTTSVWSSEDDD